MTGDPLYPQTTTPIATPMPPSPGDRADKKEKCFCEERGLEKGDTLYVSADWDGGIGFDYIRNIKFCPVCGKELPD